MTYGEIIAEVNGYRKRERSELQKQAMFTHTLGGLIGLATNEPKKYPTTAKDAFKGMGIFDEDKKPVKQDWRIMKERMKQYAYLKKKEGEKV